MLYTNLKITIAFSSMLFLVLTLGGTDIDCRAQGESMSVILQEIEKIRDENSTMRRSIYAENLAKIVKSDIGSNATSQEIDALASMLTDRNDFVRYWIAAALGFIGPNAERAVPALERALAERSCDNP